MQRAVFSFYGFYGVLLLLLFAPAANAAALPNEVSYTIDAELDPVRNVIVGRETVDFVNHTGETLEEIYFHVYPNAFKRGSNSYYQRELQRLGGVTNLDVLYADPDDDAFLTVERVVRWDPRLGLAVPLEFSVEDTLLTVRLREPLPEGGSLRLQFDFVYDLMEAPPGSEFAARWAIRSGHREGVYTIALWYPKLAAYDERGWHLEPYSYLGEFYGDFARYDVQITVPREFVVGVTGRRELEAIREEAGKKTLRFLAEGVHDFAWVASPRYRVEEVELEGVTVRVLTLDLPTLTPKVLRSLEFFAERFGPYAYPVLTAAQVTVGGGMEYPGIILIAGGSEYEVSHEVAHQWWYGAVGNDEYDEAWLDEGFATYSQELYFIEALGFSEPRARSTWEFREPGEPVLQPASEYPSFRVYAQAVYVKGAGILWMLKGLLGSETFDQILREYYARFVFQNVRTPDFIAVAEEVSGWELGWFFDPWLRTTQTLDFSVVGVESSRQEDGRYLYRVTVRRDGEIKMPVDVAFTTVGGDVQTLRWDGVAPEFTWEWITTEPLVSVEIDPQRRVLEEDRADNLWRSRATATLPGSSSWVLVGLSAVALCRLLPSLADQGRARARARGRE